MTTDEILDELMLMFPNARCELNHKNPFELAVSVALSAQTTDIAVNKVTPDLFKNIQHLKIWLKLILKI